MIKLFGEKNIRTVWDDKEEKWYFSIVDVVSVLTDSKDPTAYWRKLKQRLKEEGNETVTNCHGLKLKAADGKMRMTDVADQEQLFRLIQSIPSPKAEPFKQWMAQVASTRVDQMQDPELDIQQAIADYKRLGYSDNWINQRIKSIEVRKLRDNMTNLEMAFNILAEASATELSKQRDPQGYSQQKGVAKDGGSVAKVAREKLESQLGHTIISSAKASDYLPPVKDADAKELPDDGSPQ